MVLYAGKQVEYLSSSTAVCTKNSGFIIIYLSARVSHGLQFAPGVRYFITKYYRKYEITTVEPLAKETRVYTRETGSESHTHGPHSGNRLGDSEIKGNQHVPSSLFRLRLFSL